MIAWAQTGISFSGSADGYSFTYGSADMRNFWWSARDASGLHTVERRGWATSESGARLACSMALTELKQTKHTPKPRRSA